MTAAAALPREAREALNRFQVVTVALEEAVKTARAAERENSKSPQEIAQQAFVLLHRTLVDLSGSRAGAENFDIEGYVLASFCDETMLHHVEWSGRSLWAERLLERSIYGTYRAGEAVFELADAASTLQRGVRREVAATLFLALACGFKGRYRKRDDNGRIRSAKNRLYELATDRAVTNAPSFRSHAKAAYGNTDLTKATPVALNRPRKVWMPAAVVAAIWLTLSGMLWFWDNAELAQAAQDVLSVRNSSMEGQ